MRIKKKSNLRWLAVAALPALLAADAATRPAIRKGADPNHLKLAAVTNNASEYWRMAKAGVDKFDRENDVTIDFKIVPSGEVAGQLKIVSALVDDGYDGVAVVMIDPAGEADELRAAGSRTNLACFDVGCPDANPVVTILVDNVAAGKAVGDHLVELFPDGGAVAVTCGRFESKNGNDRLAGIKASVKGHKFEIAQLEDHLDHAMLVEKVNQLLVDHADVKAVVGLWSYEGPGIADTIAGAGRSGSRSWRSTRNRRPWTPSRTDASNRHSSPTRSTWGIKRPSGSATLPSTGTRPERQGRSQG